VATQISRSEQENIHTSLLAERIKVLTDIREHLHASGEPGKLALLNHLEEAGDWVEADLLNDTDIALLSHELVRLREIDAALARMDEGNYGACMDCGESIPASRLAAHPTAECCVPCQEKYEQQHGLQHKASL
jgi:DnaK suppressor protein